MRLRKPKSAPPPVCVGVGVAASSDQARRGAPAVEGIVGVHERAGPFAPPYIALVGVEFFHGCWCSGAG